MRGLQRVNETKCVSYRCNDYTPHEAELVCWPLCHSQMVHSLRASSIFSLRMYMYFLHVHISLQQASRYTSYCRVPSFSSDLSLNGVATCCKGAHKQTTFAHQCNLHIQLPLTVTNVNDAANVHLQLAHIYPTTMLELTVDENNTDANVGEKPEPGHIIQCQRRERDHEHE